MGQASQKCTADRGNMENPESKAERTHTILWGLTQCRKGERLRSRNTKDHIQMAEQKKPKEKLYMGKVYNVHGIGSTSYDQNSASNVLMPQQAKDKYHEPVALIGHDGF